MTDRPLVTITKRGTLPSMIGWYVTGEHQIPAAPFPGYGLRTRREARAWADRNGYRWR